MVDKMKKINQMTESDVVEMDVIEYYELGLSDTFLIKEYGALKHIYGEWSAVRFKKDYTDCKPYLFRFLQIVESINSTQYHIDRRVVFKFTFRDFNDEFESLFGRKSLETICFEVYQMILKFLEIELNLE